ncbi:ATP-binding protein [Streptomyces sp. NPDC051018]|uniref:sensor histidine kinase n=1 Tax=Streptomyces sp. NPDC051018 TaxID=3365639 RepID=UPI0037B5E0A5
MATSDRAQASGGRARLRGGPGRMRPNGGYAALLAAGAVVPSVAWGAAAAGLGPGWTVAGAVSASVAAMSFGRSRAWRTAAAHTRELVAGEDRALRERQQVAAWLERYKHTVAHGRAEMTGVLRAAREGRLPEVPVLVPMPQVAADPLAAMESLLAQTWREAAHHTAQVVREERDPGAAVITNIAPRMTSLVTRALGVLDDLERDTEDPELLDGLFRVDHTVTLVRRYVESLAVLGGRTLPGARTPVLVSTAIRSAIAQTEDFSRARASFPREPIAVVPHAGPAVVHLLTALIENALYFSHEHQVLVQAQHAATGLVIEVEDRGLRLLPDRLEWANRLLEHPRPEDVRTHLQDGRIGLLVTALLARQHGITVRLEGNTAGGTTARVILPHSLITITAPTTSATRPAFPPDPAPVHQRPRQPSRQPPLSYPHADFDHVPTPVRPGSTGHGFGTLQHPDSAMPVPSAEPVPAANGTTPGAPAAGGELPELPRRTRRAGPEVPGPRTAREDPGPATAGLMGAFSAGRQRADTHGPDRFPPS